LFFAEGASGLAAAIQFAKRIWAPVIGIALVSSLGVAIVAFVLPYLFGEAFAAAKPFLLVMALLPLAASTQNLAGDVLSGADFQVQRLVAATGGLLLSVAAIIAGALLAGVIGVVAGYIVGQFLVSAALGLTAVRLNQRSAISAQP
jgi:O-antigen/teichoic acid export membrane protein